MKKTLILAGLLALAFIAPAQNPVFVQQLPRLSDAELTIIENNMPPIIRREAATRLPGQFNVLILSGMDDTKKKNAVQYLAHRTNATVYCVDLSLAVAGNFQETRRNLDLVFGIAGTGHSIIYFEEGEALFGRRSPVINAHDRYDNQGTNYFFYLVNQYRGSVIISIKADNNINPAVFDKFVRLVVK